MADGGVRVDPPFVEFNDAQVGQVYASKVMVSNVGKTSKKIVIEQPALKLFRFTALSSIQVVAPGLSAGGFVEFMPEEDEEVRDCLLVHIDDAVTIEIPLLGSPRACSLLMGSAVDFGCVAASSQAIIKHHSITNQGSAPGVFHVQYDGDPAVIISPCSGVIAAGATQRLRLELHTELPRLIDEKALVQLQNRSAVVLSIRAEVVDHHLELFDLQGAPLPCLRFGPVHFGTSSMVSVVLRNNSPQACDWVCLLQDSVAGTEVGTDLLKGTDAVASVDGFRPVKQDASQVLMFIPKQGRLGPYETATVAVCFTPICRSLTEEKCGYSPRRQDYCLFLLFESVRSKHGFTHYNGDSSVELAVTGAGLPVVLVPHPSDRFNFLTCVAGKRKDMLCVLQNLCPQLPVKFRFRKLAHFCAEPSDGTISPGQCKDVVLSFTARQQGIFQVHQKIDVLGPVVQRADDRTENVTGLELCSFHTIALRLSAVCQSETVRPPPKLNPGITPALTNPTGPQPHVRFSELALCRKMVRTAVLCSDKTRLHLHQRKRGQNTDEEEFLAFPNDRAASLRPASPHRQYRTIFTGLPRYRYVDTSCTFTEEEEKQRRQHRQIYTDFIKQLRQTRQQRFKDRQLEKVYDVDIGLVPSQGLVPPKLRISDLESCMIRPNYSFPATKRRNQGMKPIIQVSEVINAVPSTSQEVADCNRTLAPQDLYQVDIGPLLVNFGEVCVLSVCVQKLELINRLSVSVWVQLEVDCPELQGSSPLSIVLSPHSYNSLYLIFQSSKLGPFYRNIPYSVNQRHPGQILVEAQVVPFALELSTTSLVLRPIPSLLARSEYRSSVTLRNQHNHAAEFTWRPVVREGGNLFSIRPASGAVEPYSELDCEVVWHPSFSSPPEGQFDLCVHEGNSQHLHCVAKVGSTSVQLAEKQITFESVPLNMLTIRTAVLHNSGQNHAYYKVLDVFPVPGMVVKPSEGVVPSGGKAVLELHFKPNSLIKFDTRIEIALKSMKPIELRVGGSVEPPNIDISVSQFQFSGVHVGSQQAISFTLTNCSSAATQVTFDWSEYTDFSLVLPQNSAKMEPGENTVELQSYQSMDCCLVFSPTQAASYDFDMPLMVNGVRWSAASLSGFSTAASSSILTSLSAGSRKHVIKPLSVTMATPQSQRIQATVLCAPLELLPSSLQFHMEHLTLQSDGYTKTVKLKALCEDNVFWCSGVSEQVNWWFDCSSTAVSSDDKRVGEFCTVSPSSGSLGPGQSVYLEVSIRPDAIRTGSERVISLCLPLYLGDEMRDEKTDPPYLELFITITVQPPCITIHPPQILFTPAPLEISATATVTLLALGYPSGTSVSAEVDEVELKDGTKIQPVGVVFPEGNNFPAQQQDEEGKITSLICSLSFCSAIPLSFCTTITFTDHLLNRFKAKLCAIADSCVLTVWPFMAVRRSEQQIILQPEVMAVDALLQQCFTPSPSSSLTLSSSSMFECSSSTNKNSVSDFFADSESVTSQAGRDTCIPPNRDPINVGVPKFPAENSEEGIYYQKVLLAVERWFTLCGWPSGPHPISVPYSLRRVVAKTQTNISSAQTLRVTQNKDSRSVVDMLQHLTGKYIPGISRCQTFSSDIAQRTNQLLQQHEAMLAFLRVQGAFFCHVRPEYLLDTQEFKHWCSMQLGAEEHGPDYSSVDYESLSKRSWTDVLLQIYKVLMLHRVPESSLDGMPPFNSLASNIYSSRELQLISWLNLHYQNMRGIMWGTGDAPSVRWIVNFDLDFVDGLVLASLLAAYCPYLISSHFQKIYTRASNLEQIFHNNIIVCQVLNALRLNLDIQPADLSNPNPVQMLMLCVHLYERLPQYVPLHTIELSGGLHSTFSKQVHLKNPSSKPVKYQAFLFGHSAHLFSLPNGSAVIIPSKASTELTVLYRCSLIQPIEAVLLLISSSTFCLQGTTLAFRLKTHISHIISTTTVKCKSPCYQLKVIQVPITNPFNEEAEFRVVLVESAFNPLEPEKKKDSPFHHVFSKANVEKMTPVENCEEEMELKCSDLNGDGSDFVRAVRSVRLKSGQTDTLNIHYLPFYPGIKYCSVLLVCPQVGDTVYMVKATAELPLPSPLTAKPSSNIVSNPSNSAVSALSLCCKVWQVYEEVLRVPLINMAWEEALSVLGQYSMSADEHQRRLLTHTLHSSTVRATTAAHKLLKQQSTLLKGVQPNKNVEYNVEVSLPQYFDLPSMVEIPIKEEINIPWEDPAANFCVDVPLRFQADSVGQFTCQVVLRSWCDIRVYEIEAQVTSQEGSVHLNFSSPAHQSVTQNIPLYNETYRAWKIQAVLSGEGFSGPKVVNVPAGTKACYPLTFKPSAQCIVMGKLCLHNDCDGTESMFILRGVGEHPLPVDHVVLHCPVGQTTYSQLNVPNYSENTLTLKVVTDLSVVSGIPFLEIKPCHNAPYTLSVSPWKRGKQTGCVSFVETDDGQENGKDNGEILGRYMVHFSLELICEPAAPVRVIDVQCASQSSADIEILVSNPRDELLTLDVYLEGEELSGANRVSIPPQETLIYKATFSPGSVGKRTGSVLFQSELVGEFWYRLELYALPPSVLTPPQVCCPLGKWTTQTIPLVNPTAEALELLVANSNPRNYTVEMASGSTLIVEPHSCTQLAVRFRPSSIGEGNHTAKITFTCPKLQEWCVFLSGRGLNPESEEPLSISSLIGSNASITIPFTNPTELQAVLDIKLTDEDPSGAANCNQATTDKKVFSIPLNHTEGIQLSEGGSFDVPVVFAPNSTELKQAWLCIIMKPLSNPSNNSTFSPDSVRPEQELPSICWIYPVCGIPLEGEVPFESSPLGVVHCEAGCQLERKVDIQLTGCVPGNQDRKGQDVSQVRTEDFLCKFRSDKEARRSEEGDWLSASIKAARRDPETGIVTLTLNVVYAPLKPCRCSLVLVVQYVSGGIWEFPFILTASEPHVDDVILTEATELGKTSAVGFRLTSTTRRPEPFRAAFLPGSSSEFAVTPAAGVLPPVGSAGALITVTFTPTMQGKHRARLTIQAADMQWTYEVKGKMLCEPPPLCSSNGSSPVLRPANQSKNFVARNLRLPALANSSPLRVRK